MTGPVLVGDGDARAAIANDLGRNLFVEAGAGTGKTTALVGRVVRLFATGRLSDPGRLAAITFTEAAASQLRDRIRTALDRAASATSELDDEERRRCATAASTIDEAVITTLHGFAQRLLAEHPLAAGLPPAFEVDEGIAAGLEVAARWQAFVDDLLADDALEHDLRVGFTLGLGIERLGEVAARFHDRWDRLCGVTFVDPGPLPPFDAEAVVGPLHEAAGIVHDLADVDDKLVNRLAVELPRVGERYDAAVATKDPLEVLRVLDALPPPRHSGHGRADALRGQKPRIQELLDGAADARHALLDGTRRHVLARLLPRLSAHVLGSADDRRRRGALRFHDLLVLARRLLWEGAPGVRARLADRFEVLLVDEFQDTDPIQVELVVALAAADPEAVRPPWSEVDLAPGKVLVVGDPKQSIYGFRGADITLWNRTRTRFGSDVVSLTQNFRSVGSILVWVNEVFDRLIGADGSDEQPAYSPLSPHRVALDDQPAVVVLGQPAPPRTRAAEVRLREAADVAAAIATLHRAGHEVTLDDGTCRPLRYDDVALLVPTRAPLGALERALDDEDIPYRVESRSLVWRTDVVRELLELLTAIDDPADDIAVVTALRSAAFACSDVDLLEWRQADGRWDRGHKVPDGVDPSHPVARALERLSAWHERRWWQPVDELVAGVVRDLRLVELTFAQRRPRDHWRRLRFVVDQARAFVEAGGGSLARFLEWARLQTDEGAQVVESVVAEADDDAVRILTVHGSKGLEFPVVVLAGLATGPPVPGTQVLWCDDGPQVSFSAVGGGARFETEGWSDAKDAAKERDAAESVRLLYVAATRAREQLLVSLHHPPTKSGDGSHAERLYHLCQALTGTWRPAGAVEQPVLLEAPAAGRPARSAEDRAAWRHAHAEAVARAATPWVVSPTGLAALAGIDADGEVDDSAVPAPAAAVGDEPDDTPVPGRRGGAAVGRAVHGVLQHVPLTVAGIDDAEVRPLAETMAADEGIEADQVEALARSALRSGAFADALAAKRRWREVPVAAAVGRHVIEGYVDLLYETDDGRLVVVDWKTDRARSAAEVDAALDRYELQGGGYAVALEAAVGRPVASVRFVFCRPDGPAVEREIGDLGGAVARVRGLLGA